MVTYLYCLLAPPQADAIPEGLLGLGGTPVRRIVAERSGAEALEAWVATVDERMFRVVPPGSQVTTLVLAHNEVIGAALATGRTPIPARFGQRFADDPPCLADIERRSDALCRALAKVAGCVEMGIVLAPSTSRVLRNLEPIPIPARPRPEEPRAGRRYLEGQRSRALTNEARRLAGDTELRRLTAAVTHLVRDESKGIATTGVASVSHLIRRDDAQAYRAALDAVVPASGFRMLITGPRAPYSFSE